MTLQGRVIPCVVAIACALPCSPAIAAAQQPTERFQASAATDALGPREWGNRMHRLELVGGFWLDRVHVFGAGSAWGQEYGRVAPGTDLFVAAGVDTTFMVPVADGATGASDSVEVAFPRFVEWDQGATNPFERSDTADVFLRSTYALPIGDIGMSYRWARSQRIGRSLPQLYNPEGWEAAHASDIELRLDAFLTVGALYGGALALDLDARHARQLGRAGLPDPSTVLDQQRGSLGFETSTLDFIGDEDRWRHDERVERALWFDQLPPDYFQLFPGQYELTEQQTYPGINESLRINPYGMPAGLPLSGLPTAGGLAFEQQRDIATRMSAAVEWSRAEQQLARVGVDWTRSTVDLVRATLFSGRGTMSRHEPTRAGAFATIAVAQEQLSAHVGARFDRLDPDGRYPRVPGFVAFLPDSLKRDFMVAGPNGDLIPYAQDTVGGVARGPCNEAFRTDPGNVCLDNIVEAEVKTGASLHADFTAHISDRSRVAVAVSDRLQGPGAPAGAGADIPASVWMSVLFADAASDLATGMANTATPFGRDVDLPRVRIIEGRLIHDTGPVVMEGVAFHRAVHDDLTFRRVQYIDPVRGNDVFINSLVNRDTDPVIGVELLADFRVGAFSRLALGYTWRDVDDLAAGGFTIVPMPVFDVGAWTALGYGPGGLPAFDDRRRHEVRAEASLLASPHRPDIFADLGLLASFRAASGLPYDRLINHGNGQVGPPAYFGGVLAGQEDRTPWINWLSLRVHKGLALAGARVRAFAEWSGPLGANQSQVWLETGTAENDVRRDLALARLMADPNLDGSADIADFWVRDCLQETGLCDVPGSALNAYALQQAEIRFGDDDGLFTVEEQLRAFGAWYDAFHGPHWFRRSDRSFRLGFELLF